MLPIVTDSSFTTLLPTEFRALVSKYKGQPMVWSDVTGQWPVGGEFPQIQKQKYSRLIRYTEGRQMESYLRPWNDPMFAPKYPPLNP